MPLPLTLTPPIPKDMDDHLSIDEFHDVWRPSPVLSEAEMEMARAAFRRMDANGNGRVSHHEFVEALCRDKELCRMLSRGVLSAKGKPYLDLKDRARLWQLINKDMDEVLTLDEFEAIWRSEAELRSVYSHASR